MSLEFYLGLFLSVPLALVAWLIQRQIEPVLDRSSKLRRQKRLKQLTEELQRIEAMAADKNLLITFLLYRSLLIVLISALNSLVGTFFGGVMIAVGYLAVDGTAIDRSLLTETIYGINTLNVLIQVVGYLFIFNTARNAIVVYNRARNISEFRKEVAGQEAVLSPQK
jgi:hypothetical protein